MHFSFSHPCYMTCPHHLCWIYHSNTQNAKLLQYLQPSRKMWPHGLWKLTQNILFFWVLKSSDGGKYIPSRPNKHKTLTMVSLRTGNISPAPLLQFLGANNGDFHRSLATLTNLLVRLTGRQFVASARTHRKHFSNSSCIIAYWLAAAETCLQCLCHKRPHRKHRDLYCCVSI
jgi:hypothetical protein